MLRYKSKKRKWGPFALTFRDIPMRFRGTRLVKLNKNFDRIRVCKKPVTEIVWLFYSRSAD